MSFMFFKDLNETLKSIKGAFDQQVQHWTTIRAPKSPLWMGLEQRASAKIGLALFLNPVETNHCS